MSQPVTDFSERSALICFEHGPEIVVTDAVGCSKFLEHRADRYAPECHDRSESRFSMKVGGEETRVLVEPCLQSSTQSLPLALFRRELQTFLTAKEQQH